MSKEAVLQELAQRVSYFRASSVAPAEEGWIGCGSLVAGGAPLAALIAQTGRGRGTEDQQVAASSFVQAYAFRLASIVLGAFALELPIPDPQPSNTAIRIDRHRPAAIAFLGDGLGSPDAHDVARVLLAEHCAPLIAAVRECVTVGERLLWGNVAASCAVVFRALDTAVETSPATPAERTALQASTVIHQRADAFLLAAAPWLNGLGAFETIVTPVRTGWYWNRTSCCLWYAAVGGTTCDDCSLLDRDTLAERRRDELTKAMT